MELYIIIPIVVLVALAVFFGGRLYIQHCVEQQIVRFQNDLTIRHCEEVENMYRQTRGWRHDFKNHLQTMQAYLEMEQIERLGQFVRELTEDYNEVDIALKTGNTMLDAILNSKISILKEKEIRVDVTASLPEREFAGQ